MGSPLTIELDDPGTGSPLVTIRVPDYSPIYDPNVSADVLPIDGFGIDAQGNAYIDTDRAASDEQARVAVDELGNLTLVR